MRPEYHNLKSGLLWITVVDKEYNDAFKRAGAKMEEIGAQMQTTGDIPYMCGFCTAYGEIMMAGVNAECVETDAAHICLVQSGNPDVGAKLHTFGARSAEEMAKVRARKTTE